MLEIPGEEAPTDPGLQARMKKDAEEKVRLAGVSRRNKLVGGAVSLLLIGAIGAGVASWKASQEALVYDVEDYYALPLEDLAAAPPEVAPVQQAPEATPGTPGVRKLPRLPTDQPVTVNTSTAPISSALPTDGTKRASNTDAGGDLTIDPMKNGTGTVGIGTSAVRIERLGMDVVLTDEAEIFEMAKRVLSAYSPQVQNCYNQRLKQKDGLAGVWNVNFVITTEGSVRAVTVKGASTTDSEMEQCITRTVSAWKFQKIAKERPLSKPYRFGPAGW